MTAEQIETIARKAHWICACHLSPAIMKDPNRDRYWEVMSEEFREPWREIVRLVAAEVEDQKVKATLGEVLGYQADGQPIVRYPSENDPGSVS